MEKVIRNAHFFIVLISLLQRPLSLGADLVCHSITKYINGHSDVIMGCVMTDSAKWDEHLFFMQLGLCAPPFPMILSLLI